MGLGCYRAVVGRTGTDSWDFGVGYFEADIVAAAVLTILLTFYDKQKINDFVFHNLDISHPWQNNSHLFCSRLVHSWGTDHIVGTGAVGSAVGTAGPVVPDFIMGLQSGMI